MRYQWLPYNYTLAYENASKGWPLARSLNFTGENPEDKFADVADEYMWGNEVLVAPVMESGAVSRKVLFPKGKWYDWFDPTKTYDSPQGGLEATVDAPLDKLPLFIRAGSFIPQCEEQIENVTQYNPQLLTMLYFPAEEKTEYVLFDDDRKSPTSLQDGNYQLTTFTGEARVADNTGKIGDLIITLDTNEGRYEGMPPFRMLTFKIMDVEKPNAVTLSDAQSDATDNVLQEFETPKMIRQYGWCYNKDSRILIVRFPWNYTPTTMSISH